MTWTLCQGLDYQCVMKESFKPQESFHHLMIHELFTASVKRPDNISMLSSGRVSPEGKSCSSLWFLNLL